MNTIQSHRIYLERKKGERAALLKQVSNSKDILKGKKRLLRRHEQAREIIREVGLLTQQQLQYHISDISSLALEAIFGEEAYQLKVNFVERRNKTECDLLFVRNEKEIDPLASSGGGAVDVAAFALRVASWSMQHPHTRNTIILDEPLRFLDSKRQEKASQMIKQLAEQLNIQFIIVTHEEVLTEYADKIFKVGIEEGVSYVEVL